MLLNIKHLLLVFCILIVSVFTAYAQKYTISGIIKDKDNGETIVGVVVLAKDTATKSIIQGNYTNSSGFYSISLPKGIYLINVQYIGYTKFEKILKLTNNQSLNIELEPVAIQVDEVEVTGKKMDQNVSTVQVGKMEMKIETIKTLPALMGEVDILKSIQLLPGIQSGSEGNSGFYVRGGNADQNLILLDDAPIYNAGHLFGFFSIFNADAVKSVEILKSGIPANYGGRLSSILDVTQKEGNMKKYEVDGGVGLIFSRLTVQGPIKKDKASFIVSGRRTYIDYLVQPFLKDSSPMKGTKFYFYDLNAKVNVILNDKHRIFIGGYFGDDTYGFKSKDQGMSANFLWSNSALSARWTWIVSPKMFLHTTAIYSNYEFETLMQQDQTKFSINSGIRDYTLKTELSYIPNPKHVIKAGVHYIYHSFYPTKFDSDNNQNAIKLPDAPPYYANDLSFYVTDQYDVTKWLSINAGLRFTIFQHIGTFTRFVLDEEGYIVDSIVYKKGEVIKQYNYLEPRISARITLDKNTSIKASYTINYQPLHQISLASITLPTDVWIPSTDIIKPQQGHHFSLGIFKNFKDNTYETYIDGYYKIMNNLAEYKDNLAFASLMGNQDQMYTFGRGRSYGVEVFLNKTQGKFHGFIGYTLSYTQRQFDDLNNGNWFYAKYDRRHDVSINLNYDILPKILTVSVVWIYASGNTMTIPVGYYFYNGHLMTEFSDRNAYRMPAYHRLDFSISWQFWKRKNFESGINFSVYNVYNRKNPFYIYFSTKEYTPSELTTKAYKVSLFPIIPSITWNFKIK
jgi:hypothetical protein